jgi:hypothetical protein
VDSRNSSSAQSTATWCCLSLIELKHADLCERQRFGGLPRLVERAVHRNVVLLILASLIELEHVELCERQRFGGLPRLVERAVHRNVVLLT